MSEQTRAPFIIRRDGAVVHREGGHVIGTVWLDTECGWMGSTVSGGALRPGTYPNGKKYAGWAVWRAVRDA